MSDSLLTRYRPTNFDQVIGQDVVVAALEKAINKKAGRAFLFTGPSGTGKTTLARIAAKVLGVWDGELREVDAASETGIDDMRRVADDLCTYRPLIGECKGALVDEAHALSKPAMTSLLKSIEEPPSWAYWFLCTTETIKLPDTMRNRCLRFDLKPVSRGDLRGLLDLIAAEEQEFDGPQGGAVLDLCAQEAYGSPRQAIANLGAVMGAKTRAEAAILLRTAVDSGQAVDLARALCKGAKWNEVQRLLRDLGDVNPESVRHVIRAYTTKVVLGATTDKAAGAGGQILDAFDTPFHSQDGISPLVLACLKCHGGWS